MDAREMFEQLGYKLIRNDDRDILYIQEEEGFTYEIVFCLYDKIYTCVTSYGEFPYDYCALDIDMKLHKAIHQQLKELGWIE